MKQKCWPPIRKYYIPARPHIGQIAIGNDNTLLPYNTYTITGTTATIPTPTINKLDTTLGNWGIVGGKIAYIAATAHIIEYRAGFRLSPFDNTGAQIVQSPTPTVLRPSIFKNGTLFGILYTQYLPAAPYSIHGESPIDSRQGFASLLAGDVIQFGWRQQLTINNMISTALTIVINTAEEWR